MISKDNIKKVLIELGFTEDKGLFVREYDTCDMK